MKFHAPVITDAGWAVPLLEKNYYMESDFAFSNIFMWQDVVDTNIARFKNFVITKVDFKKEHIYYQYPGGTGDIRSAIEAIIEVAKSDDRPPLLTSIPDEGKVVLENLYPETFNFVNARENSDYIYLASDLANLSGSKFKKKRNHCSHFERSYSNWEFLEMNEDVLDDILAFNQLWLDQSPNVDKNGIRDEALVIKRGLENFTALGLKGGYLTIEGRIVAYTYGYPMGNMFTTHVEKALYEIHGGYPFINREMARLLVNDFKYINREDDVGEQGLRKSKLSYRPIFLVNKWRAEFKTWPPQI